MVKKQQEVQQDDHYVPIQPIQPQFNVFNRKQQRKEKKLQRKSQHMNANQERNLKNSGIIMPPKLPEPITQTIVKKITKPVKKQLSEEEKKKIQLQKEIEREDQEIEKLTKKLKLKNNRLTKSQLQSDGYEDDLFDFLDYIDQSMKDKRVPSKYDGYQKKQIEKLDGDIEIENDQDKEEENQLNSNDNQDEDESMQDDENENDINDEDQSKSDYSEKKLQVEDEEIEERENNIEGEGSEIENDENDEDDVDDDEIEPRVESEQEESQSACIVEDSQKVKDIQVVESTAVAAVYQSYDEEKLNEIKKLLNRNLNKLSEANINNIVEEINKIFENHPKQIVGLVFAQQLVQSTIKPKAILPYLLTCITASSCYFHQVYDNLFFGELIKQVIIKIRQSPESHEMKNIALIFCHWYLFESISLLFIKEFIQHLIKSPTADNIENINSIIQYCGKKIRSDNPSVLKQIIDEIKEAFSSTDDSRTRFLLMTLEDLRMNKKISSQSERMDFILNWHKQKTQKLIHRIFCQGFVFSFDSQFISNSWWKPIVSNEQQTQLYQEFKQLKKDGKLMKLEQLSVEQKMVTETRKAAFVIIMGADDLFEATQNLDKMGYLKKKKQDVTLVIVEMCGNEMTYNPYYVELAHYLINFERGLKQAFQYILWDKFKLLENYTVRKQINIAKFAATLLKKQSINLLLLKWFNYDELPEIHSQFLCILLQNFLLSITIDALAKQCKNLFENEDYLPFRCGLQAFVKNQFKHFIEGQIGNSNIEQIKKDLRIMMKLLNEDITETAK